MIPMTEKLYDNNPYDTAFAATVLECRKVADNEFEVVLDRTLFFPEEGGQSPDEGMLGGYPVLDVQIREERIYHRIEGELTVGENVAGEISWEHRFSNMQQHSGEHIFSGTVCRKYGYNNVGFHLSDQTVTMDFDGPLSDEQVAEVEAEVNEIIFGDTPIVARYVTDEELAQTDYRSKKELAGPVRLVTIYGKDDVIVDICACCAPHVAKTGEIGLLKVVDRMNYKGGVRISILCGRRALLDFRNRNRILSEIGILVSGNVSNLVEQVRRLTEREKELKYRLSVSERAMAIAQAEQVPAEEANPMLFFEHMDTDALRESVNAMMEKHSGVCGAFAGTDESGYSFVIGSKCVDLREITAKLRAELGAKGGGKPNMIQGSVFASKERLKAFFSGC